MKTFNYKTLLYFYIIFSTLILHNPVSSSFPGEEEHKNEKARLSSRSPVPSDDEAVTLNTNDEQTLILRNPKIISVSGIISSIPRIYPSPQYVTSFQAPRLNLLEGDLITLMKHHIPTIHCAGVIVESPSSRSEVEVRLPIKLGRVMLEYFRLVSPGIPGAIQRYRGSEFDFLPTSDYGEHRFKSLQIGGLIYDAGLSQFWVKGTPTHIKIALTQLFIADSIVNIITGYFELHNDKRALKIVNHSYHLSDDIAMYAAEVATHAPDIFQSVRIKDVQPIEFMTEHLGIQATISLLKCKSFPEVTINTFLTLGRRISIKEKAKVFRTLKEEHGSAVNLPLYNDKRYTASDPRIDGWLLTYKGLKKLGKDPKEVLENDKDIFASDL
jgi:hypothetical protein